MSDGTFTILHRANENHVDVVDGWGGAEKLPDDEVVIPPEHDFSVDDADQQQAKETQEQLEKKWLEIGMQQFQ